MEKCNQRETKNFIFFTSKNKKRILMIKTNKITGTKLITARCKKCRKIALEYHCLRDDVMFFNTPIFCKCGNELSTTITKQEVTI